MSKSGICLFLPLQIPPGAKLRLSLVLVLGGDSFSESLDIPARVIWCTPHGELYQVGARFGDFGHAGRGHIDMFLRFLQQEVLISHSEPVLEEFLPNKKFDTGDADKT